MQTDILASTPLTADGQMLDQNGAVIPRTRVKAVYIVPAAGAGSVVLRDGGASGQVKVTLNTVAGATASDYIEFPGQGLLFQTNVYADVTTVASVMVFYG